MQEMQETWVQSPSQEDPLEEGMATHSSILAGRIPWTEEPARLQSMDSENETGQHSTAAPKSVMSDSLQPHGL